MGAKPRLLLSPASWYLDLWQSFCSPVSSCPVSHKLESITAAVTFSFKIHRKFMVLLQNILVRLCAAPSPKIKSRRGAISNESSLCNNRSHIKLCLSSCVACIKYITELMMELHDSGLFLKQTRVLSSGPFTVMLNNLPWNEGMVALRFTAYCMLIMQ